MKDEKKIKMDVFKEAAIENAANKIVEDDVIVKETQLDLAMKKAENTTDGQWEKLKGCIEDEFAERFMNELRGMGGRDFVRNYLNVLEYFKPKITRTEGNRIEEEDNTIHVHVHTKQDGIENVIDITPKDDAEQYELEKESINSEEE